jgi:hypothetical protein
MGLLVKEVLDNGEINLVLSNPGPDDVLVNALEISCAQGCRDHKHWTPGGEDILLRPEETYSPPLRKSLRDLYFNESDRLPQRHRVRIDIVTQPRGLWPGFVYSVKFGLKGYVLVFERAEATEWTGEAASGAPV